MLRFFPGRAFIPVPVSFTLPWGFVAVMPEGRAGLGNEFGAAVLDEIASLGDDALQQFDQFPDAGFAINKLSS